MDPNTGVIYRDWPESPGVPEDTIKDLVPVEEPFIPFVKELLGNWDSIKVDPKITLAMLAVQTKNCNKNKRKLRKETKARRKQKYN